MSKLLKKIEVGNPLYNLGLFGLLETYDASKTDEELVNAYHHILDSVEGSRLAENLTYSMIAYSTNIDINPLILLIHEHNEN